jgi:hypothetical protein
MATRKCAVDHDFLLPSKMQILAKKTVNVFPAPHVPIANMALIHHLGLNQE